MSKRLIAVLGATLLLLSLAVVSSGQEPKKVTTVQTSEGTYTIVEYPVGKETTVTLNPISLTGATGTATVLRAANGTTIKLNLTSLPAELTAMNVYAIDPMGAVTLLGPIEIANGAGTFTTTSPLTRFMLITSQEAALTAYDANTKIFFRSAVPAGLSVIPFTSAVAEAVTMPVTNVQTVVKNPEGTFTVVEYPVGKQTVVTLNPIGLSGATGRATILRDATGTTIKLNLTSLPADLTAMNVYAIDPTGAVTLLGPVVLTKGVGSFTTTTPLTKFMLITSPEAALTAYDPNTKIFFRSAVPTGLSVIPLSGPVGEQVAATVAPTSEYSVPMLGIPTFKKGDDTKLKINFAGPMEGARANIFIKPDKKTNKTQVTMRFHELKEAPKNTTYVLWAVSPDNQFQNLGRIINIKGRNEAEIKSEVAFSDFGLFLTTEELGTVKTIIKPAGHRVGIIQLVP